MNRPAACDAETRGRMARLVTADAIRYSDGTTTLWRPSGPVTFPTTPHDPRRRARWIVYATGWGRATLRRADAAPEPGWVRIASFRAAAGPLAGTPSREAMRRFHSLDLEASPR